MVYTTRKTVNIATFESWGARKTKGGINLYVELQKHKIDQIAARRIRLTLATGVSEENRMRANMVKYDIRDKRDYTYCVQYTQAVLITAGPGVTI